MHIILFINQSEEVVVVNSKELRQFFKGHLVPSRLYDLRKNHKGRICMEKSASGWSVYFSDKKQKVGVLHYKDEASACAAMKNEVRKLMEGLYGVTWFATPVA